MLSAVVLLATVGAIALGVRATAALLEGLALEAAERLALALALFPASLGLAAFAGFILGWPGPWLPLGTLLVLLVLACITGAARKVVGAGRVSALSPARGQAPPPRAPSWLAVGGDETLALARIALGLFALGSLGTLLLTPVSGGAYRIGDWLAHWFLVLVYLGQPLPDTRLFVNRVGDFGVVSRPPLYNLESGVLVGVLDGQFWPFQISGAALGIPLAAVVVLWARNVGGMPAARLAAPLCALSPFLIQNVTYPWPKVLAALFVLLFLHLVRGAALARASRRRGQTVVLAAACASFGYLAHPSSALYVLPTALWLGVRRPRPLLQTGPPAWGLGLLIVMLVLAPWHLWAIATFGLRATVEASPALAGTNSGGDLGGWAAKTAVATLGSLLPLPLLGELARGGPPQLDALLRVQIALLPGALGLTGCLLLARAARRAVRASGGRGGLLRRFVSRPPWLAMVALGGFAGQAMLTWTWHPEGEAAESMTPIVALGLAYVAREAARLGHPGQRLVVIGILAEFAAFHALLGWWAFGSAWTRDTNAVLAARYGLAHIRSLWAAWAPLGVLALLLAAAAGARMFWRQALVSSATVREGPLPHGRGTD